MNRLANLPASSAFYLQVQRRFWTQPLLLVAAWCAEGKVGFAIAERNGWR